MIYNTWVFSAVLLALFVTTIIVLLVWDWRVRKGFLRDIEIYVIRRLHIEEQDIVHGINMAKQEVNSNWIPVHSLCELDVEDLQNILERYGKVYRR